MGTPRWWSSRRGGEQEAAGRVIVGIDDPLAGLQALREAAGLARRRGMELLALRACKPGQADSVGEQEKAAAEQVENCPVWPLVPAHRDE